jgi:glycerophosphoryl diester phosphodiesterase
MKAFILTLSLLMMIDPNFAQAIDVQGHRGARSVLPENSLPGLKHALELGVNTLEFDMGVSKDGVVVVIHDQQINPVICQNKDGTEITEDLWVHQLNLDQIKNFDCGSKQNPRFPKQVTVPGTEIPTLAEVFEMVTSSDAANAKTVAFNIETKSNPNKPHAQPAAQEFVAAVLKVVQQFNLESRVTLQSFDPATLIAAKNMAPDLQLALLLEHKPEDWVEAAEAAGADIVSPYHKLIGRKDVEEIQDAGLAVIPWTANSKRQWSRLMKLGVDGIITDDPEALLRFLERL